MAKGRLIKKPIIGCLLFSGTGSTNKEANNLYLAEQLFTMDVQEESSSSESSASSSEAETSEESSVAEEEPQKVSFVLARWLKGVHHFDEKLLRHIGYICNLGECPKGCVLQ